LFSILSFCICRTAGLEHPEGGLGTGRVGVRQPMNSSAPGGWTGRGQRGNVTSPLAHARGSGRGAAFGRMARGVPPPPELYGNARGRGRRGGPDLAMASRTPIRGGRGLGRAQPGLRGFVPSSGPRLGEGPSFAPTLRPSRHDLPPRDQQLDLAKNLGFGAGVRPSGNPQGPGLGPRGDQVMGSLPGGQGPQQAPFRPGGPAGPLARPDAPQVWNPLCPCFHPAWVYSKLTWTAFVLTFFCLFSLQLSESLSRRCRRKPMQDMRMLSNIHLDCGAFQSRLICIPLFSFELKSGCIFPSASTHFGWHGGNAQIVVGMRVVRATTEYGRSCISCKWKHLLCAVSAVRSLACMRKLKPRGWCKKGLCI
jgi:hypothetical protein